MISSENGKDAPSQGRAPPPAQCRNPGRTPRPASCWSPCPWTGLPPPPPGRGIGGGGQRPPLPRGNVHPLHRVVQPADIPQEHLGVGHQMMAEGDRLRPLKVGVPRHHRAGGCLRLPAQHPDQPGQLRPQRLGQRPAGTAGRPAPPDRSGSAPCASACPRPRCGRSVRPPQRCGYPPPHIDGSAPRFQIREMPPPAVPDRLPVGGGR